ncbi:hypothetical protein JEZ13_04310 [bacterium]|nr:hypothetical protein [bacterium]
MVNDIIEETLESFISSKKIGKDNVQNNVSVKILLDEYSLEKSEIILDYLPEDVNIRAEKYFLKNELGLFTLRSCSTEEIQRKIKFKVLSFEYEECQIDKYVYRSSYLPDLLYAVNSIDINNLEIKKITIKRNSKDYYYYEIKSEISLSDNELRLIFYILSFMTASLFFKVYEKQKSGKVKIINMYSRRRRLLIYASGDLMYKLDFQQIYDILSNKDLEVTFYDVAFLYSRFTTADDKINQFLNGCNLLEFLLESYISKNKSAFKSCCSGKATYSNKLYFVAENLFTSNELDYFRSMFADYPSCFEDLDVSMNKDNYKNSFFLFKLRNNFVHNGKSFEIEDWPDLSNTIFVINEILRILISKFDKITPKYKETTGIKAKDMKEIIKNREKIFNSN